jgi:predicted ATPase/DNA-binding SARP family transcriptional activator
MRFGVLGPLLADPDGTGSSVPLPAKQRIVLACLLLSANRMVPLDRLIRALWDEPPRTARITVQGYVKDLRNALGDDRKSRIVTAGPGYVFNSHDGELDLHRFGKLRAAGIADVRAGDLSGGAEKLRAALALWRGEPLVDVLSSLLQREEVPALTETWLQATELRVTAELALGRQHELTAELRALTAAYPLREKFHEQLMLALYRSGRHAEAIDAYRQVQRLLAAELGVHPGPELRDLHQRMLTGDTGLRATSAAGPRAATLGPPRLVIPGELPIPSTRFIGREREVADVRALLTRPDVRFLTLTGPPGAGKTRLALEVSSAVAGDYRDGVVVVALGSLSGPAQVMPAIRQALGLPETRGRSALEAVAASCRDRQGLMVLDNIEHLLAAGQDLADLVDRCPGLQMLVTSRAAVRIRAEHAFMVPPLRLPGQGEERAGELRAIPAVELFLERAAAAKPGFEMTTQNAPAVAAICRRLDGLPLALELAAPWVRLLTPQGILSQLESRLELLVGGPRDLPPRQRAMRSALAWSCDLLDGESRTLLRRLAIFQGSAPLDALADVCQASGPLPSGILRNLGLLAEHALVLQHDAAGGVARVNLLETVRDYGRELLVAAGEYEQTAAAHLEYYAGLSAEFSRHERTASEASWLERLRSERDNVRSALRWACETGPAEAGLRLAASLTRFWIHHGFRAEGLAWLNCLLEAPGDVEPRVRARALMAAGDVAWRLRDYDQAVTRLHASLEIFEKLDDIRGAADTRRALGDAEGYQGNFPEAERLMELAIMAYRGLDERAPLATALGNLGIHVSRSGDRRRATALYEEALALYREVEDRVGMAMMLTNLGHQAQLAGNVGLAESRLREAVAVARQLDVPFHLAAALSNLSDIYRERGDVETACAGYLEAMELFAGMADVQGVASCLRCLAWGAWAGGDFARAARWYGAAEALSPVAMSYDVDDSDLHDRVRAELVSQLGDQEYAVTYDTGSRLSMTELVLETSGG